MIEVFKQLSIKDVILLSLVINVFLFLLSITFFYIFSRLSNNQRLQSQRQKVTIEDTLLSLLVLVCNALVFVVGFLFWQKGMLIVQESTNGLRIIVEVVFLVLIMDFLMYVFHRIVHLPFFYKLIHLRHHHHQSTNAISLFVLHPIEALGFGSLIILVIFIYPFSYLAISIYLFVNLFWGTIGHLDKEVLPYKFSARLQSVFVGTTRFHNNHHQNPHCNYGFYTVIWDKLFGTLHHHL